MQHNATFSANQLKFIDWLAVGKFERDPPTEELFAEKIGVNRSTLYRWKRGQNGFTEAEFWGAVNQRAREHNQRSVSNVYGSLRDFAVKGSFQHQKLLLELVGEYTETQRREISGPGGGAIQIEKALDQALEAIYGDNTD